MSASVKPPSRRSASRKADSLLSGLLRTPKTRPGLVAAVINTGVGKHFVYGWLADQLRTGKVAALKSSRPVSYQMAALALQEKPTEGKYPTWLEPRFLPVSSTRKTYLDGKAVPPPKGK